MTITSTAFKDGNVIPVKYTCKGSNISPPLVFGNIPEKAKSLVLIMHDPDSTGSPNFLHWVMWNISPTSNGCGEGSIPENAIEGKNNFGKSGYGGPCPQKGGNHRYIFSLYALDEKLEDGLNTESVEHSLGSIGKHIIAGTKLTGIFSSNQ